MRLTADVIVHARASINPCDERELDLRGYKIPMIENLGVTQDQFDAIDFSDNEIKKLDNFPRYRRLSSLLLCNNHVSRIAPDLGRQLPNLTCIILTNNKLSSLGDLDGLGTCEKLTMLSLMHNEVVNKQYYRLYVINLVPSLKQLDFQKVTVKERASASRLAASQAGRTMMKDVAKEKQKSNTFTPGGPVAAENNLTAEHRRIYAERIAAATTVEEVEMLTRKIKAGIVPAPNHKKPVANGKTPVPAPAAPPAATPMSEEDQEEPSPVKEKAAPPAATPPAAAQAPAPAQAAVAAAGSRASTEDKDVGKPKAPSVATDGEAVVAPGDAEPAAAEPAAAEPAAAEPTAAEPAAAEPTAAEPAANSAEGLPAAESIMDVQDGAAEAAAAETVEAGAEKERQQGSDGDIADGREMDTGDGDGGEGDRDREGQGEREAGEGNGVGGHSSQVLPDAMDDGEEEEEEEEKGKGLGEERDGGDADGMEVAEEAAAVAGEEEGSGSGSGEEGGGPKLSATDIKKLKVTELKAALGDLNLPIDGLKPALQARLLEAHGHQQ